MGELWMWLVAALAVAGLFAWRRAVRQRAAERDAASAWGVSAVADESPTLASQAEADDVAEAQAELMRLAAEAEAEREAAARERAAAAAQEAAARAEARAEAERQAAEQAEAERQAVEQAALAREAAEREARAERERLAAAQAEAERQAAARAEAERLAAAEQAERERRAAEQAAEREAEREAELERKRQEAERAAAERLTMAQAQQARQIAEREAAAERERLAAAQAEIERLAAARAEAEQQAAEQAERERLSLVQVKTPVKGPAQSLVMVVDDSKVVRIKTGRLLAAHHYQVAYANDGLEAVQQLQAQRPDVVITDVEMPGMDGFALTRHVRAEAALADIPVIMITAADERHRDEASQAGVSVLLGKPYPEDELIAHIRRVLGQDEVVAGAGALA